MWRQKNGNLEKWRQKDDYCKDWVAEAQNGTSFEEKDALEFAYAIDDVQLDCDLRDGSKHCKLIEVKQFHTQNGKTIEHPSYTVDGNQQLSQTTIARIGWLKHKMAQIS